MAFALRGLLLTGVVGCVLCAALTSVQAENPQSNSPVPPAVVAFLADPSSLLASYPRGGSDLVSDVRKLVLADLATLRAILKLSSTATVGQKNAIGTGIGLAALALLPLNPQAAGVIQNSLVTLNDQTLLAAYAAVTGDQHLAAAGPGGGGGGSPGSAETSNTPGVPSGGIEGPSLLYPNFGTKNIADVFAIPTFTTPGPLDPPTTVGGSVSPTVQ